jgi:beta-glucosidase
MDTRNFPQSFQWGAATASFQVEGASLEGGRGTSIWDTFCATPGKVANGDNGHVACDHFHRFRDDIALMKSLGINTYRFSLAWPRLFPNGDSTAEPRGFEFYNELIDALVEAGIQPVATVYHWDLPQALQDQGGWANRSIVDAITEYSRAVVLAFGDRVKTWITLNEPWVYSWLGYGSGIHAPGISDHSQALAAAHHSSLAHGQMTRTMRDVYSDLKIGISLNMANVRVTSANDSELANIGALMDSHNNRFFMDALTSGSYPQNLVDLYGQELTNLILPGDSQIMKVDTDFVGLNYYSDSFVHAPTDQDGSLERNPVFRFPGRMNGTPPQPLTDMGWPITPWGIRDLLNRVHRDWPQIPEWMITENGAAYSHGPDENGDVHDAERVSYLTDHIQNVGLAISDGCPVSAYFYWSFMDNFEWAEGYNKRFGIVHVDFETQKRTVKESGFTYAGIIAEHKELLATQSA